MTTARFILPVTCTLLALALGASGCGGGGGGDKDTDDGRTTAKSVADGVRDCEASDDECTGKTTGTTDAKGTATTGHGAASGHGGSEAEGEPAIVVDTPRALDVVAVSFVLEGEAEVFEGLVRWQLIDVQKRVAKAGSVTATCGTGCRGKFRTTIKLADVEQGNYTFEAFSPNTADGGQKRLHLVTFPLTIHATRDKEQPAPPDVDVS